MTDRADTSLEAPLLPCPFCGGEAHFHYISDDGGDNDGGEYIECARCAMTTPLKFSLKEDAKPLLAEMWNTRATPAKPEPDAWVREFEQLAAKATQGPVDFDTIESDGAYGVGEDCHHGFSTYAVVDANGKTIVDALNSDVAEVHVEHDEDGTQAWDQVARQNAAFIAWCFNNRARIAALISQSAPTPAAPAPDGVREARQLPSDGEALAIIRRLTATTATGKGE